MDDDELFEMLDNFRGAVDESVESTVSYTDAKIGEAYDWTNKKVQERERARRRQKRQEYLDERGGPLGIVGDLMDPIENTKRGLSAAWMAGQGATFHSLDDAMGLFSGIMGQMADPMGAVTGDFTKFHEGMARGQTMGEDITDASKDTLGFVPSTLAEMAGGMAQRSGPGLVGKAFGLDKARNPGFFGVLGRSGKAGAAGGTEAAITNIMEGGGFMEAAMAAGLSAPIAGTAQALLGEALPTLVKYGLVPHARSDTKVAQALFGRGLGRIDSEEMRSKFDEIKKNNTTLLSYGAGDLNAAAATSRMHDILLSATFGDDIKELGGAAKDRIDDYASTVRAIDDELRRTSLEIQDAVASRLERPKSAHAIRNTPYRDTDDAVAVYESMKSTDPKDLGGQMVKFHDVQSNIETALLKAFGHDDPKKMKSAEFTLYNHILKEIRPRIMNSHAKSLERGQHANPTNGVQPPSTINLDKAEIPVAFLAEAVQDLGSTFRPGMIIDNNSVTPNQVVTGLKARDALYDVVADYVPDSDFARAAFAEDLAARDATQMGAEFAQKGWSADPDYGRDLSEFIDYLDTQDPKLAEQARYGYRQALRAKIDAEGPVQVLTNMVGPLPKDGYDGTLGAEFRKGGYDNLVAVLGQAETDDLLREVSDKAHLEKQQARIRGILTHKGFDPEAIRGVEQEGDNMILAAALTPHQQSPFSTGSLGALARAATQLSEKDAETLMQLLTYKGEDAANLADRVLKNADIRRSFAVGDKAGVTVGDRLAGEDQSHKEDRKSRQQSHIQQIEDYLSSLANGD